jgi:hypothetical protein
MTGMDDDEYRLRNRANDIARAQANAFALIANAATSVAGSLARLAAAVENAQAVAAHAGTPPVCKVHGTRYCPDPKLILLPAHRVEVLAACRDAGCPPHNWANPKDPT